MTAFRQGIAGPSSWQGTAPPLACQDWYGLAGCPLQGVASRLQFREGLSQQDREQEPRADAGHHILFAHHHESLEQSAGFLVEDALDEGRVAHDGVEPGQQAWVHRLDDEPNVALGELGDHCSC